MPRKKAKEFEIELPEDEQVEMRCIIIGEPRRRDMPLKDEDGMTQLIETAHLARPDVPTKGLTLQALLDGIGKGRWRPGPGFSVGQNIGVWIVWRPKRVE